jgi:CheY-like chemotaxis protein
MTCQSHHKASSPLEILVLDDDLKWRQLIAFNVELHLGISPVLASNGKEALKVMTERHFDVVLSDLFMPEMDGFEFLQRARALFPRTKVILLSGDFLAFPVSPERLIQHGALATVPKAEISTTLQDLLIDLADSH